MNAVISHNKTVLSELEPGDTVAFKRGLYSHYGVFIGEGKIVHLAGDGPNGHLQGSISGPQHSSSFSGKQFNKAKVKIDEFLSVAGNSEAFKANKLDAKSSPLPRSKIVRNALSKVGHVGYNIVTKNCEHFANWCRYEMETSQQIEVFLGLVAVVAVVAIVLVVFRWWGGEKEE